MAIKFNTEFKWIQLPDAYLKVMWMDIFETGEDEKWKLYRICAYTRTYTNESKEHDIKDFSYYFENLRVEDISLEWIYNKLTETKPYIKIK